MTAAKALQIALELISLAGNNVPKIISAVTAFKDLFDGGKEPTQAEVDALIDKVKTQGDDIAKL
jgi:hypothetical protein